MKRIIVHFKTRPYEIEGEKWDVSACYWAGAHLAMSPDWAQVTCKNCLKSKPRDEH